MDDLREQARNEMSESLASQEQVLVSGAVSQKIGHDWEFEDLVGRLSMNEDAHGWRVYSLDGYPLIEFSPIELRQSPYEYYGEKHPIKSVVKYRLI